MASRDKKILLPYQRAWVEDCSPLKIWLAARQIGKSFALAFEAVVMALKERCNILLLSASERQSREVMEKVYSHLRALKAMTNDLLRAEAETKTEVRLPGGSRIISLPASPDTVRGFSGHVFLDEFAFHRDARAVWLAMYPTISRGYRVSITSTPNGKLNMFYDIWAHGEEFSRHKTDIYEAKAQGLDVDIERLRRGMTDPDGWAQEFECQFLDEATAYITYEMIASCEDDRASLDSDDLSVASDLYMGVDIGRRRDLTVIWVCELVADVFWTRVVKRLEKAPFRVQREELFRLLPYVRRACIDATGLGMQLAEEAQEAFGTYRVEAVTFTAPVKEELAVTLRRRFEDREVRIPPDREIREDIHAVKKFTTAAGNIRFDAERTEAGHSDHFWALALALHAGTRPGGKPEVTSAMPRETIRLLRAYA